MYALKELIERGEVRLRTSIAGGGTGHGMSSPSETSALSPIDER